MDPNDKGVSYRLGRVRINLLDNKGLQHSRLYGRKGFAVIEYLSNRNPELYKTVHVIIYLSYGIKDIVI